MEVPEVPLSEPREGRVGRVLIGRKPSERHVIKGGARHLPRGRGPDTVAVEPELQEEGRVEGEVATLGVVVSGREEREVDLRVDELGDEPGEVILGEPVVEARWEEEVLMGVVSTEVRLRSRGVHDRGNTTPAIVPPSEFASNARHRCATDS